MAAQQTAISRAMVSSPVSIDSSIDTVFSVFRLRNFIKDSRGACAPDHLTDEMRLRRGVAMVKLHDVRSELPTAIAARNFT